MSQMSLYITFFKLLSIRRGGLKLLELKYFLILVQTSQKLSQNKLKILKLSWVKK